MKFLDKMHKYKIMPSYCLKCKKKYIENINPRVSKTSNYKAMLLSKCAISRKQQKIVKNQDLSKSKKQMDY